MASRLLLSPLWIAVVTRGHFRVKCTLSCEWKVELSESLVQFYHLLPGNSHSHACTSWQNPCSGYGPQACSYMAGEYMHGMICPGNKYLCCPLMSVDCACLPCPSWQNPCSGYGPQACSCMAGKDMETVLSPDTNGPHRVRVSTVNIIMLEISRLVFPFLYMNYFLSAFACWKFQDLFSHFFT